jgi:Plasmid pRiA4b ORF-3-like protein
MGHPPATMMDILKLVADCSSDCSGRREAEIMFLHQQPLVLKRSAPTWLKLRPADRPIFVWLYEDRPTPMPGKTHPTCTGGSGACPPEDCGGPASFMDGCDRMLSPDALDDLDTMVEIVGQVALERPPEILDDDETMAAPTRCRAWSGLRARSGAAVLATRGERAPGSWRVRPAHSHAGPRQSATAAEAGQMAASDYALRQS